MAGAALEVMRGSIDNVPVFELRESLSGAPLQPFSGPFFLMPVLHWASISLFSMETVHISSSF